MMKKLKLLNLNGVTEDIENLTLFQLYKCSVMPFAFLFKLPYPILDSRQIIDSNLFKLTVEIFSFDFGNLGVAAVAMIKPRIKIH